ncbi:alpha-hydroxy-acid oxidizing protein [Aquicoccus porphyridii]|uniref:Alpha-hydroxy-acid oxidizing protein n=1 Tax=Aquicoccus porphyridii TaxID=1852029 RepID=A0A5A9ZTK8_9RHOB|nr:alpha-hydroxy acid oxidase [Aquicoccus porphyridii]KAA0920322.1 alpha-hydroxy-acid oxidizing protein [Aquicoccus porphyridii]RAI54883.1 alpha-hydroxy-acid oxidizing protein [Rhodobacteraceae bacterium AsT-22]
MDLHTKYPGLPDLATRARQRIPHFVFEYLDSGTGSETTLRRNREKLDEVLFHPSILRGTMTPELSVKLFDKEIALPFGIAPVGMSGLIWPNAEKLLAKTAARAGIPYCLSTVASQTPEDVAPVLGDHAWFQLYPPKDPGVMRDLVGRVKDAGFKVLAMTVDVPVASRRERQTRSGLTQPPRLTPRLLWQVMQRPEWALGTLRQGRPRLKTIETYVDDNRSLPSTEHIGYLLRTSPDAAYLAALREAWDGPLVLKGVMDPNEAKHLADQGVDGVWLSNHAGRQFDGAPASIEVLPTMREATDLPIIFDSGIAGGLDILRALALGADFVMMGRAWHYALAALGTRGPDHLLDMFTRDIVSNMGQIGIQRFTDLPSRLVQNRS